jgi:hypothetical protein
VKRHLRDSLRNPARHRPGKIGESWSVFGRSEMTSGHIPAKGEPGPD